MVAQEHLSFLAGSEQRVRILSTLADGAARPADLVDELDISRTTIQRNLAEMRDRGWIRKADGQYRATVAGECILNAYDAFHASVVTVHECSDLLKRLPPVARSIDPEWLVDATVTTARSSAPHAAIERYEAVLSEQSVEHFRGISPVVSGIHNDLHAPLLDETENLELIIDEEAVAAARERYPTALAEGFATDDIDVYVSGDALEFGLSIFDDYVVLGAYDDDRLQACIESGADEFVEWSVELFERFRSDARRLAPDDLPRDADRE